MLSTTGSLASTLGTVQPFRYRGYVYDVETGLYYLRSRYYNPIWNRFINADSLNSVCNNLFIYCCNVPVNCCDTNGFDAIWITDTNSFSHSSLLIQDSDGVWYYYYWGAAGSGSSGSVSMLSNSLSGRRGNVNVIYEQIDLDIGDGSEERILSSLNDLLSANNHNNIYHYPGDYDRATYLYGDFTVAHSQAEYNKNNSSKLIYDLFSMNCAQSVADLLIKAYEATNRTLDIYYLRIKKMWNAYIPNHMHNILDGIEPGEDETENRNM